MTWVQWLQNIVNLMTLVELGAFIVSAYQFWAGRRERKGLEGADFGSANFTDARLSAATLDGADLTDVIRWCELKPIGHASIEGVRHTPAGVVAFAREQDAVDATTLAAVQDEDLAAGYSTAFRVT